MKEKMLVSLDGAVESLVTAWLLKKQGYQLRAVLFDVSEGSENRELFQQKIAEIERQLNIQVQLVECGKEAREVVFREIEFGIARGYRYDIKTIFHQKFLFPKLFALKEQYQFQKIASGHRVILQHEPLENKMKVSRYHDPKQDESHLLVGLTQSELQVLEFPLGSIPITMIHKLAAELNLTASQKSVKFEMNYKPVEEVEQDVNVFGADGGYIGNSKDVEKLSLGEMFLRHHESSKDQSIIFDINPNQGQMVIGSLDERVIKEVWLENASWFSDEDLGFRLKSCFMSWKLGTQPVPVQLIQYEGGGMKALLNEPISGAAANLFAGDTVLWVDGESVMGGARVVKCL